MEGRIFSADIHILNSEESYIKAVKLRGNVDVEGYE
jgi:hypothetical protein